MPSLQNHAFVALLKLIRRKRIYESPQALMRSIQSVRASGPARPSQNMLERCDVQQQKVDGQPVFTVTPKGKGLTSKQVVYLHGGAYVRPITRFHWQLIEQLVCQTGLTITVPLYPLAPEHTCEQAVAFALKVIEQIRRHTEPTSLVLMGDSAGGGLALACCLALELLGQARPDQLLLITPWVHVDSRHPRLHQVARRDPMLAIEGSRHAGRLYAGHWGTQHPWVSPAMGETRLLPPTTVWVGTRDLAHLDALDWARQAKKEGAPVHIRIGRDMIHVWPLLPIPEGRQARLELVQALRG